MTAPTDTLAEACRLLADGRTNDASVLIGQQYPFRPVQSVQRKYTLATALRVFTRDGFIDRYSGDRLVFPGALRLLALKMPDAIPYHLNWKVSETHQAFWHLCPTIDHIVPVARGGEDSEPNMVSTSQLRNSAKSHWLLDEISWELQPAGDIGAWDGLTAWFRSTVDADQDLMAHAAIASWYRVLGAATISSKAELNFGSRSA